MKRKAQRPSASVLVVDPDEATSSAIQRLLSADNHRVRIARSGEEGLELCAEESPSLVLLDINLPGIDGLETLRRIKEMGKDCAVVMVTAYESASTVVGAMKLGAEDYITKPLPMEELRVLVDKLVGQRQHYRHSTGRGLGEMVGDSAPMRQVYDLIRRIAKASVTVLITGESGTGKEVVARAIHQNSERQSLPFLSVSCASIPGSLLEAELFGYERGAFTDAKARKKGLIEVAGEGTLLLDEIGLMPVDLQGKLLSVLETRRFRRLGGTGELSAPARFVAATNANLEEAVRAGEFREDLYYRLNVIPIHLPPLRERGKDILLLAQQFLRECSHRHGLPLRTLSPESQTLMMSYAWPGNVRELKNVIERAVLLTDEAVVEPSGLAINRRGQEDLEGSPIEVSDAGIIQVSFPPWGIPLEDLERQVIEEALIHTEGNISQAARLLHISRYALRYRMQKHGIPFPEEGHQVGV